MADQLLTHLPVAFAGRLVDLGCGTGDLLGKLAAQTGAELTGVDLAAGMLGVARERLGDGVSLIKSDLTALPLGDAQFDVVVSNAAIQWCKPASAFDEMHRILRPGGRLLVSTFGPGTMWQWREALAVSGAPRVHTFASLEDLVGDLTAAGFGHVETQTETVNLQFETVKEMMDSVRKLGATNARNDRPQGLMGRRWLDQFADSIEARRDSSGKLSLAYECIYLMANRSAN